MGSEFYTFDEAARRLGRSKRSIHNYLKLGFLKRQVIDGKVLLQRDDVEQLAIEQGSELPAMNRRTFFQMEARIRKLEEQMSVARRALEIRDQPLRPEPIDCLGLVNYAKGSLAKGEWSLKEISSWASVLDRMDEVSLDLIEKNQLAEKDSWKLFYNLCLEMMKYASAVNLKSPDLLWQQAHMSLDEGRKKLRGTILMWIEAGRGSVSDKIIKEFETGKEDLLKRVLVGGKTKQA